MSAIHIDRNVLFGVIALQDDLIDQKQFTEACAVWALRLETSLTELLLERGWITSDDRREIERKIERKIKKHGNIRASLAAVAGGDARDAIRAVDHPEIRKSLSSLPPAEGHVMIETMVPPHQPDSARYTLTRMHAEGGLGRVWLARDGDLHRGVALKEIRPERSADRETWRRFLKEAQITGQLEHPNIVPVYELGRRREDDQPFYTMRFVRGQSLLGAIQEFHRERAGKPPDRLALQSLLGAFLKVCDAIAYAHSRGVVHRDLKPENIVLGGFGEVVVLDWGLAKLVDAPEEPSERNAVPGERISVAPEASADKTHGLLGTPCYMAPEQVEQKHDQIDSRTDIYALGGILFEILTGHPPAEAAATGEVLEQVRTGRIPRARQVEPTVPRALEAVCAKAMALDRSARYARVTDLADEVRRWIADEPINVYRDPLLQRTRRWVRRHLRLVTAAAAAAAVALLALGISTTLISLSNRRLSTANTTILRQIQQITQQKIALDHQRLRAEGREDMAIQAIEKFRDAVANNPELKDRMDLAPLRKTLLKEPQEFFRKLKEQLQAEHDTRPEALSKLALASYHLAETTGELGDLPDAIESYEAAIAILEPMARDHTASADDERRLGQALNNLGNVLNNAGRQSDALAKHRAALALRERLAREHPDEPELRCDIAVTHNNIGAALGLQERRRESLAEIREAETRLEGLVRECPGVINFRSRLALCKSTAANTLYLVGQHPQALAEQSKALDLIEELIRAEPKVRGFQSQLGNTLSTRAIWLNGLGDQAEARKTIQRSVDIQQRLADEHPTLPDYRYSLAQGLINAASIEGVSGSRSLAFMRRALEIDERLVRDYPGDRRYETAVTDALFQYVTECTLTGQFREGETALNRVLPLTEQYAREHPMASPLRQNLPRVYESAASLFATAGQSERALGLRERALAETEKLHEAFPESYGFLFFYSLALVKVAKSYQTANRPKDAESLALRALAVAEQGARTYPGVADFRSNQVLYRWLLGQVTRADGRLDEAVAHCEEGVRIGEELTSKEPGNMTFSKIVLVGCYNDLAMAYHALSRNAEARRELEKAGTYVQLWGREKTEGDPFCLNLVGYLDLTRSILELDAGRIVQARLAAATNVSLRQRLVKARPGDLPHQNSLAGALGQMGVVEWQAGNLPDALQWAGRAVETARSVAQADPGNESYKRAFALASWYRAETLTSMGRFAEAGGEWDRAISSRYAKLAHILEQRRAVTAAWRDGREPSLNDLAGYDLAAGEADLLYRQGELRSLGLYHVAQVYVFCHRACLADKKLGPAERSAKAESYAARSVELLRRAESTGLFNFPLHRRHFEADKSFAPLRSRPDFRLLLADIDFPADPFDP